MIGENGSTFRRKGDPWFVCDTIEITAEQCAAGVVAFALRGELDIATIPQMQQQVLATIAIQEQYAVWGYGLMSNHVHLTAVPAHEAGLGLAIGRAHMTYARHANKR